MQEYLSVAETAKRFNISNRRVQLLCEQGRIENAQMISGVWVIPAFAQKPHDGRKRTSINQSQMSLFDVGVRQESHLLTFDEVCSVLSVSAATGRNWVKLEKIVPVRKDDHTTLFSRQSIEKILQDIATGESNALSRRRNKRKISGLGAYGSYVSSSHNINLVDDIIAKHKNSMNFAFLRSILANIALQFICQKNNIKISRNAISDYLQNRLVIGSFSILIDDILGNKDEILKVVDLSDTIFTSKVEYVPDEDTLGFVYISLVNLGERKTTGTYYTPLVVVNKLIAHLSSSTEISGKTVFDPCCGSGNFLLSISEHTKTPELLYGQDIDLMAVQLARISFALKYDITNTDFLYTHFTCADTLKSSSDNTFDIVLGNPPWGGALSKEDLKFLANKYQTVTRNGAETYSLFIECSFSLLVKDGLLAFVVPEAILNVAAHRIIRKVLMANCNFKFIRYLGNVFSGVQCPSVILGVEKTETPKNGIETVCFDKSNESFSLHSDKQITVERFNFHVRDDLQDCLDIMNGLSDACKLSENANFALGIVTGDNTSYISDVPLEGYEPVLKGNDVKKYRLGVISNYIRFIPHNFQQVAPTEFYRAPEKLIYRFICETLVFAYDDKQTLSLNSCNILIPQIPNMNMKYILAILNSRVANFYFINMFNSVKVLRSHIEQIPIPTASAKAQEYIVYMAEKLINNETGITSTYDELDDQIMSLYDLDVLKRQAIVKALAKRNLFLPFNE